MRILLVDDNTTLIQAMARMLRDAGQLQFATDGETALAMIRREPPDLVLLDAEMPGMDGFEVCAALKADPACADVPVIFVTGHSDAEFELRGLEVGAVDFIAKPVSAPLLQARVRTQLRIKKLTDELRQLASNDGLTGIANRRGFDQALEREWKRCRRSSTALSLLMIDIDHFKRFNDRYGHPAGDVCLRAVAQALQGASLRPGDMAARLGGEEFAILLPDTPAAGASDIAQRVIEAVDALAIAHEDSSTASRVTISIGIAACAAGSFDGAPQALVQRADEALYRAKAGGRARACIAEPSPDRP